MKVFISWSGERSQELAKALHDWLPLVLHYVEPWLSEADISAGDRWAEEVAKELELSNFGIVCTTRENVNSSWVLFEAGALAKSMEGSKVIPLLLDLDFRDITGPLAQFQAKKVEKKGLSEIVSSINKVGEHSVPEGRAGQLFEALWPDFEKTIRAIPDSSRTAKHIRSQAEVLEELVASVRSLDSRFREIADETPQTTRKKKRFQNRIYADLTSMLGEKPGDPVSLLVAVSAFREELPFLYELGVSVYKAAQTGSPLEVKRANLHLVRAMEVLESGFPLEELGVDPMTFHLLSRGIRRYFGGSDVFENYEEVAKLRGSVSRKEKDDK